MAARPFTVPHFRKWASGLILDTGGNGASLDLGLDPGIRAERLPLEAFVALANAACISPAAPSPSPDE